MKTRIFLILLGFLTLGACQNKNTDLKVGDEVQGKVVGIQVGDTYDLELNDGKVIVVRMEGIDAPDAEMPFHAQTVQYLEQMILGKEVKIHVNQIDQEGRYISNSYLDGAELGHQMLKAGMAFHFSKYNNDPELAELEKEARAEQVGIWAQDKLAAWTYKLKNGSEWEVVQGEPMAPWVYRQKIRDGETVVFE